MLGSKGFVGELLHIDLPEVSPMAAPDPKFKSNQWSCNSLADGNKSLLTIKQEVAERKAQLQAHFTSWLGLGIYNTSFIHHHSQKQFFVNRFHFFKAHTGSWNTKLYNMNIAILEMIAGFNKHHAFISIYRSIYIYIHIALSIDINKHITFWKLIHERTTSCPNKWMPATGRPWNAIWNPWRREWWLIWNVYLCLYSRHFKRKICCMRKGIKYI